MKAVGSTEAAYYLAFDLGGLITAGQMPATPRF